MHRVGPPLGRRRRITSSGSPARCFQHRMYRISPCIGKVSRQSPDEGADCLLIWPGRLSRLGTLDIAERIVTQDKRPQVHDSRDSALVMVLVKSANWHFVWIVGRFHVSSSTWKLRAFVKGHAGSSWNSEHRRCDQKMKYNIFLQHPL